MSYTLVETIDESAELAIPYSKFTLENGLTVIVHEDHHDPLVHVDITYHVGSGREEVGKSGFAHFFEHMMFEGSKNVGNNDHFKHIAEAGGTLNGSTNRDRTNYYETLPKNHLELALWLESDRMGFLLDAVTQEGFENQRSVIKNEKAQRYENQPYGMLTQVTQEHFYPENHPYSWTTIGYTEDLDRVTTDDLKEFFAIWYGPNNAVLTIGGDVNTGETIALVDKYFGSIPRGPEVYKPEYEAPVIDQLRRVNFKDKVRFPMLQITLPTVEVYHEDEAALDILADILGNGKNSRLYEPLVKQQKAVQVYASNFCYEGCGEFRIGVFAYPNQHLEDVEKEIQRVLEHIKENGVTEAEVKRASIKHYSQMLYSLESVKNKVSRLAAYHTFAPTANFIEKDVQRYKDLTADDIMRVLNKYIYQKPSLNVTFYDDPHTDLIGVQNVDDFKRAGLDEIPHAEQVKAPVIEDNFDRSVKPEGGPIPVVTVPDLYRREFENGLQLMGTENWESPTLSMTLSFNGGSLTDVEEMSGLSTIYARMARESSEHFTAKQISEKLDALGSSIQVNAAKEEVEFKIKSLREGFNATMELLKEILFYPLFDANELARIKHEHKELLAFQQDEPEILANRAFYASVYGEEHPLGKPTSGRYNEIDAITPSALRAFQEQYLNPENCRLVVSGAISETELMDTLEFLTIDWKRNNTQVPDVPRPNFLSKGKIVISHKEGAAQSEIRIGYPAMPYSATGEYFHASVMNYALGSAFNSRINLNLREDKGYTYGARSYFQGGRYKGPFVASAAVAADVTADAVKEFLFELNKYREDGITEEELEFTKKSLLYREALKYETNSQKNSFMLRMLEFGLVKEYVDEQKEILSNIATTKINELAVKHLPIEDMVIVIAGDKNVIEAPLRNLDVGEVVVLQQEMMNV